MPVYEIDYTPSFYVIENTAQNIEIINLELSAVDYLRLSVSCLVELADVTYQTDITNEIVLILNQVSSKILLTTNIPVTNFNAISIMYGDLDNFPSTDYIILNPQYLGGI